MGKQINLQGFKIKKNLHISLYVLEMPTIWLDEFRSKFFDEKNNRRYLKTKELKDIMYSINKDIVYVGDFFSYPYDSVWIIATNPISLEHIWAAFKGWQYSIKKSEKILISMKETFEEWISHIEYEEIGEFRETEFKLTDEEGFILDNKAYDIIPNLVRRQVHKDGITINGHTVPFDIAEGKRVMSNPNAMWREVANRKDYYSITIEFSIQTTPHQRQPILLYKPVITRWVTKKVNNYVLGKKGVKIYLRAQEGVLYPIMLLTNKKKEFIWEDLPYEIIKVVNGNVEIPDATTYAEVYPKYMNEMSTILAMTYNIGMGGKITTVKSGLPMKDKDAIHTELHRILQNIIEQSPQKIEQFIFRSGKMPDKINFGDTFRAEIAQAIGDNKLALEIYSDGNEKLVEDIRQMINEHFNIRNDEEKKEDLKITINYIDTRNSGILSNLEGKNELEKHEKRIRLIRDYITKATQVTACIVILPYQDNEGNDYFNFSEDPKKAIRAGLAMTGRLTQFLTPNDTENKMYRLQVALLDLYRQLGYVNYGETNSKLIANYGVPVSALHVVNFKKTPYGNFNRMPVLITCDKNKGQVLAECPTLWNGKILYREACLRFQELATREGQNKVKNINTLVQLQQMITTLYYLSKQPHLLIVKSDGTTRNVWKLLTDSELSKTNRSNQYSLSKIWFNKEKLDEGINTEQTASELRIMRIRNNEEVPEYITNRKETTYESTSGMYVYEGVYYGIAPRLMEAPYRNTFGAFSKIDKPNQECKLPDMVEIYPMHLKGTDDAKEWVSLVNNYRNGAHQYKWILKNPLPLHLATQLEEYIY